ncbi:MAG: hypothetical protein EB079_03165, partial [Verrucomicrobia bacterium]|nr:hypothetical protein [Verrucomicrobiota bacterium]
MDKFTYSFPEEKSRFILRLFTFKICLLLNRIGSFRRPIINDSSSLKEQSLVREMKVCSHLKALR